MNKRSDYKYHSLSIPIPIIEDVKEFIQDKPEFSSVAEFAKFAMKEKMQREKENNIEERLSRLEKIIDKRCNKRVETVKQYLESPLI